MNHDDFARHGADLLERVQQQVDAPRRLRQLGHHERNTRVAFAAVAAAVVVVFAVLGGLWWLSDDIPPVDQPETTTTTLRSLPVETSIVLLDQFTIDEATGSCTGVGEFSRITEGATVRVVDDRSGDAVVTVELEAGAVIDAAEIERLDRSSVEPEACRFVFVTGLGTNEFNERDFDVGFGFDGIGFVEVEVGLRLTLFYGGEQ